MSLKSAIKSKRDEVPFLIFIAFLIAFTIARLYEYFQVRGPSLTFGRYTLHHFYYGVALLIIAGWIAINYESKNTVYVSAIIYGGGLGLFFDEIGLMLTHFENYWDWITYTMAVIISLIFLNIIFFRDFWNSVGNNIATFAERKNLKHGPLNLMGLVSLLNKGTKHMPETGGITTIFIGLVLMGGGVLVLEYPDFLTLWIAASFIVTGIAYLVETIKEI